MRKTFYLLGLIIAGSVLFISCGNNSPKKNEKIVTEQKKQSLWSDSLKNDFVKNNAKTDFDKFVLTELIKENEFSKSVSDLKAQIQAQDFYSYKKFKTKKYIVVVDDIAGKSKSEIEKILGKPNNKEKVNPSKTPCPCDKFNYLYDLVEVVFINGKADWITINNTYASIHNSSTFLSVSRFDDYTYVKVTTK